jgi:hypothetical protein
LRRGYLLYFIVLGEFRRGYGDIWGVLGGGALFYIIILGGYYTYIRINLQNPLCENHLGIISRRMIQGWGIPL